MNMDDIKLIKKRRNALIINISNLLLVIVVVICSFSIDFDSSKGLKAVFAVLIILFFAVAMGSNIVWTRLNYKIKTNRLKAKQPDINLDAIKFQTISYTVVMIGICLTMLIVAIVKMYS